MSLRRRPLLLVILVLVASLGSSAVAEAKGKRKGRKKGVKKPPEDPVLVEAKRLFGEAQALYDLGRFEEALVSYEAAYEAKKLAAFLFNIGQCHRNLGDRETAVFFFKRFLEAAPDVPNRADVEASVALLERELADEEAARKAEAERKRIEALSAKDRPVLGLGFGATPPREKKPVVARWWFWTVVGVAVVAGGGAGTYFYISSRRSVDGVIDHR